ncbi:probable leucine aminopeptidase 1 [Folsomia candida]|uniref:Putative leucine aminopeptidase 1 n=1 Tax=Folsomia candida TaxID=158441 RepID=A0A226EN26_FOLCA|nr:probable leucine aminopeptidase 1 [Folsomia candida]OXA59073.1 putative leucine aminopeptidase 1 [Folsomia candida]
MTPIKVVLILSLIASAVVGRPSQDEKRLIKISPEDSGTWLTEDEIFSLIRKNINFIDITGRVFPTDVHKASTTEIPVSLRFQSTIVPALARVNISRMQAFVDAFDNFTNRYYLSATGVDSSDWLLAQVSDSIANTNYNGTAVANSFLHSWPQNSVIARIEGSDPELRQEVIIFGAHMDSINGLNPSGPSPGSDDNASGSVTLLEALRVILESGIVPKRSIEFQWYAAEEVGLRGSGDIAQSYFTGGKNVVGMVNFDVVGYQAGANEITFLSDNTDATLTTFLKLVTDEYCTYPWVSDVCGYACSDHASFNQYGFRAACSSERPLNPYMHTTSDTMSRMSFPQIAEFVKMTVGAAIEIAEPTTV